MARTLTAREVIRRIESLGGVHVRTKGSHATYEATGQDRQGRVEVGARVPVHRGDVPPGTLRAIERQLCPAFGEGWLIR